MGNNPKNVWWNDEIKAAVRRKEVLAARIDEAKERYMEAYREKKRRLKGVYIRAKKKVN